MNMQLIWQYLPALLTGLAWTVVCWAAGCALGLGIGVGAALMRAAPFAPLRWLAKTYIEVFRGTPFLIQVMFLYSAGPSFGLRLEPVPAGILAVGLYGGAYFAEVFRGGVQAVSRGQIEAARCLGMSPRAILWRILTQQVLVATLPTLLNTMITLIKETVVLSIIVVPELMYQVQTMAADTFAYKEAMLCMALFYWTLVEIMARSGRFAETRLSRFLPVRPARNVGPH
jgi:polar amino acid transport system permease protein